MFEIGSYVVCPGHGVGQVFDVERKDIGGEEKTFYIVKVISNGMKVMIPTDSQDGLRVLMTETEIDDVFVLLTNHEVDIDNSTWNRRHREYLAKVKTGSLLEIADVLRSLFLLKVSKKLSFGEKKMMEQCRDLIVREVAIATGAIDKDINSKIDSCFND